MDQPGTAASATTAPARLLAGRYEVDAILGQGGMGEVRAGRDVRLGRDVAIKLLRADMAHQPAVRERFANEARMAAQLVHPHVVALFDTAEDGGVPFLVMERLPGTTLADAIASGPMSWAEVRELGLQILSALDAAHAGGLIHRDVKPRNILAAGPGNWKIGDFGIAKSLELVDPNLTGTGLIVGTPIYLAPERLAGAPATISGDLYSAGAVLYESLTGRRLFETSNPALLVHASPRPVSELRPDVPPDLAAVVMRAIARDPAARYGTAAQMAAALQGSSGSASPPVGPAFAPTVAARPPAPFRTEVLPAPPGARPLLVSQRRRALALVAGGAVVLLLLAFIVLASGSKRAASTPAVTSTTGATVQTTTTVAPTSVAPARASAAVAPRGPAPAHGPAKGKKKG